MFHLPDTDGPARPMIPEAPEEGPDPFAHLREEIGSSARKFLERIDFETDEDLVSAPPPRGGGSRGGYRGSVDV